MIAELFGNVITDLLGIWCGCKLSVWLVSRKIRALGKDQQCPKCDGSFALNPHIYKTSDNPTEASWRNPSLIAEFRCATCGTTVEFLYTDPNCLTLISPSKEKPMVTPNT